MQCLNCQYWMVFEVLCKRIVIVMLMAPVHSYLPRYTFEFFLGPTRWSQCVKLIGWLISHGCDVVSTSQSDLYTDFILAIWRRIRKCSRVCKPNFSHAPHKIQIQMIYQKDMCYVTWGYRRYIDIFRNQTTSVKHIALHDIIVTACWLYWSPGRNNRNKEKRMINDRRPRAQGIPSLAQFVAI